MLKRRAAAVLAGLLGVANGQSVTSCGGPNDHVKNLKLDLSPDPIQKGKAFSITVTGTMDEDFTGGTLDADLQIKALGVINEPVKQSLDFTISPAIPKGDSKFALGPVTLPSAPSDVAINGQVHLKNTKGEPVACLDLKLDVPAMEAAAVQNGGSDNSMAHQNASDFLKRPPDFERNVDKNNSLISSSFPDTADCNRWSMDELQMFFHVLDYRDGGRLEHEWPELDAVAHEHDITEVLRDGLCHHVVALITRGLKQHSLGDKLNDRKVPLASLHWHAPSASASDEVMPIYQYFAWAAKGANPGQRAANRQGAWGQEEMHGMHGMDEHHRKEMMERMHGMHGMHPMEMTDGMHGMHGMHGMDEHHRAEMMERMHGMHPMEMTDGMDGMHGMHGMDEHQHPMEMMERMHGMHAMDEQTYRTEMMERMHEMEGMRKRDGWKPPMVDGFVMPDDMPHDGPRGEEHEEEEVDAPPACTQPTDHLKNIKTTTSGKTTTTTFTLDEDVTVATVDVNVVVKALFVKIPLDLKVPVTWTPGLQKGDYTFTSTETSASVQATFGSPVSVTGQVEFEDGQGQEITCIAIDSNAKEAQATHAPLVHAKEEAHADMFVV